MYAIFRHMISTLDVWSPILELLYICVPKKNSPEKHKSICSNTGLTATNINQTKDTLKTKA